MNQSDKPEPLDW